MSKWLIGPVSALIVFVSSTGEARTGNIRFNPFMALLGHYTVNVDFNLNQGWTVGPEIVYWNLSSAGLKYSGSGFGVRSNYYFAKKYDADSWYLGASLSQVSMKITDTSQLYGNLEASRSFLKGVGLGGYHWSWETFNIHLGAGFGFASVDKFELKDSTGTVQKTTDKNVATGFGAEFAIGWFF